MPGLKLTLAQAARLFNLDRERCARALHALVNGGLLRTEGDTFLHARAGRRLV
jgi:DNA-binding IclR family transcriptional regulator